MRRSRSAVILAAALVASSSSAAFAQAGFEGVIAYEMTAAGSTMNVEQTVKGTQIRQEMEGPMGPMISIMDISTMDMTMIIPAQKMYMKMNTAQMMEQLQAAQQEHGTAQPDPEDLKATGQRETIAGHSCEHYTYTSETGDMDICIATGLGFMPFATPSSGMGNRGGGLGAFSDVAKWRARFGDGFIPLAMRFTDKGTTITMRATRVEPGSVPASAFAIPGGYTEMRMPGGR